MITRQSISALLKDDNTPAGTIQELQKSVISNEKKVSNVLPPNFIDGLQQQMEKLITLNLPASVVLKVAEKQADLMIAHALVTGMADAIVSSDSDFAAYAGERCLCIKKFKFSYKDGKIEEIILSTGEKEVANDVANILWHRFKLKDVFSEPR